MKNTNGSKYRHSVEVILNQSHLKLLLLYYSNIENTTKLCVLDCGDERPRKGESVPRLYAYDHEAHLPYHGVIPGATESLFMQSGH